MKMNLRFNALKVAELEKTFNQPIENIISDMRLDTLATIVSKGYVDEENDKVGCSISVAYDKITEYLKESENGKQDLVLDIIDEFIEEGFLPKAMKNTREIVNNKMKEVQTLMN